MSYYAHNAPGYKYGKTSAMISHRCVEHGQVDGWPRDEDIGLVNLWVGHT